MHAGKFLRVLRILSIKWQNSRICESIGHASDLVYVRLGEHVIKQIHSLQSLKQFALCCIMYVL
jgi:hypothetical protein